MGPFDFIQKKGSKALKPQPAQIRKEIISTLSPARRALSSTPKRTNTRTAPTANKPRQPDLATFHPAKSRNQVSKKRLFSAPLRLESDSDDDTSEETLEASSKRSRVSASVEPASNRQLRCKKPFSEDEEDTGNMVHAAEIATLGRPTKYKAAFPNDPHATKILLHYPSELAEESYELVVPIQSDDFKPLEDIKEVLEIIATHYLPPTETSMLKDDSYGLLRRLKRSIDRRCGNDYIELIEEWNDRITRLRKDGTIGKVLDGMICLDLKLIERILTQTYSRTVSLHVGLLRHYENGTDNVYGELLPKFISDILRKDTKIKSTDVFVDLGSGVGNVVLQAALEIGCESWGCEMMDNACDLAELQKKEFRARCRLWGLSAGSVHLERGDFLENVAIGKVLKTADVVLVNNQAFTPELNEGLISLFLDLKEGCQIVSLKSFVPSGHKITSRNLYRACNVLDVVGKRYYSACVSWTDAPGTYYVSTKDSSKLKLFANDL